jgi:hypothetical protein
LQVGGTTAKIHQILGGRLQLGSPLRQQAIDLVQGHALSYQDTAAEGGKFRESECIVMSNFLGVKSWVPMEAEILPWPQAAGETGFASSCRRRAWVRIRKKIVDWVPGY